MVKRQEANYKILDILKQKYPQYFPIYTGINTLIKSFADQRFAQLVCNYVCPDYRDNRPSMFTSLIMYNWFPGDSDPFYEESVETLKRLTEK